MDIEPVVITGMGMAAPLGLGVEEVFRRVCAAECGIGPLSEVESTLPAGSDGGQAPDLPADFMPGQPREVRYLRHAIEEAARAAGWPSLPYVAGRRGVLLGTTLHGMRAGGAFLRSGDHRDLSTFLAADTLALATAGLDVAGPRLTTCSACSSSLDAIALGVTLLQAGDVDVVLAGGYDTLSEYVWAGFNALRLVSGPPLRPFVRGRQGMKIAEGYGVVVLERQADAQRRSAPMQATVAGWGESADAFHLTRPDPSGNGAARSMRMALSRAALRSDEIGLVAAHATGTPDNDTAEAAATLLVLGKSAGKTPVVGFKSHLGHTLGGAGAVELILSAKTLATGRLPGCANVNRDEVEFTGLNLRTGPAIDRPIEATLNTSLGFGGANTSAVLTHPQRRASAQRHTQAVGITGIGVLAPGIRSAEDLLARNARPVEGQTEIEPAVLNALLDARRTRRLSPYVRHMLAVTALAIKHARLEADTTRLETASAFLATTHGSAGYSYEYYGQIVREGVLAANPMLFAEGVPNAGAAHVSLTFGLRGGCRTIIGTTTAGLDALHLAAARVAAGDVPMAIVGAAEEPHAVVDAAYRCYDPAAVAGIAAGVALVIEPIESAITRGITPLATVLALGDAPASARTIAGHVPGLFSVGPLMQAALAGLRGQLATIVETDRTGAHAAMTLAPYGPA